MNTKSSTQANRREHFRLNKPGVRIGYKIVSEPEELLIEDFTVAAAEDLSGSGVALQLPAAEEAPVGTRIQLKIELVKANASIDAIGEVVRRSEDPKNKNQKIVHLNFTVIEEADRDKIIGYLFSEQIGRAKRTKS